MESLVTARAIVGAALPAALLKAAAIAGAAVQTALLGRLAPSSSLAAYAAVTVSLRTATLLFFSFFVDAAAARLSHSLGRRDITTARSQAALNLTPCLVLGSATAAALLAGRQKLLGLLRLEPALLAETLPFWTLVAAAMPCTLANLAICVILQGLRHVGLAAALEVAQACVEVAGTYAVLTARLLHSLPRLQAVGWIKAAATVSYTAIGLACVACVAPAALGAGSGAPVEREPAAAGGEGGRGREADLPLLAAEWSMGVGSATPPAHMQPRGSRSHPRVWRWRWLVSLWAELLAALSWHHVSALVNDAANVAARAMVVQGSTLLTAVAAARLGAAPLAAHHIATTLWVLPCHLIAGLQAATLVLGARLATTTLAGGSDRLPDGRHSAEQSPRRLWRCLVRRLLVASTCLGAAVAACYLAAQQPIIHLFTSDAAVAAQLLSPVWHAMCLLVLLFAPTLTLTGLIFAAQLFAYMRCLQLLGFALVFCPALWAAAALTPGSLAALWAAKLAFYAWQLAAEAAGVASTC